MVEIRDQTEITSLENAWKNCGVLNTASTGDIKCLPISDVRNVQNILMFERRKGAICLRRRFESRSNGKDIQTWFPTHSRNEKGNFPIEPTRRYGNV